MKRTLNIKTRISFMLMGSVAGCRATLVDILDYIDSCKIGKKFVA